MSYDFAREIADARNHAEPIDDRDVDWLGEHDGDPRCWNCNDRTYEDDSQEVTVVTPIIDPGKQTVCSCCADDLREMGWAK